MKSAKKPANRAFYLVIGLIAIAGIAALTYASTRPKAGLTAIAYDSTLPKVESQGYVIGSDKAPVEVVEFGDFECPQCGRFATLTEPDIRSRLVANGTIRWRFIDYPLEMHHNTWQASMAAACANEQGKFWEMHDAIFAAQDRWDGTATNNPNKVLKELGAQIGLDKNQFNSCVDEQKTKAKVQAHWKLAMDRRIPGTPTFFFGNQMISAFLSYDQFKNMVDTLIAKSGGRGPSTPGGDTAKGAALKKPGT